MSDENAEKALNPFDVPDDITDYSHDGAYERGVRAGIASRDAEVLDDGLRESRIAELRKQLAVERTRADKAEASLANLEAGFKSFMRSHNRVLDANERLREVIERASVELHRALPTSRRAAMVILDMAAVPVEPQTRRPHYEVIVPGCDCVGCFGETLARENGSE